MAWGSFFGVVMGAYALYYVLNILYDLFFARRHKATAQGGAHYSLRDLASDEEQPYLVADEPEVDPDYDHRDDGGLEEEYDEGYDDEQEQGYLQEEAPEHAPSLKVEGQGIPLDDFLKDAQSYSKSIF